MSLCAQGVLPYKVLDITLGNGPDACVWAIDTREYHRVEFKRVCKLTDWNHRHDRVDLVVCWRSTYSNPPFTVIELESLAGGA